MELTRSLVEDGAREYEDVEPLYAVEQEHVEVLHGTFESGQYGWRDVEWVVQWYYRRHLGAYPDDERRATEAAFRENDFEDVRDAVAALLDGEDLDEKVGKLRALEGVDVALASAFLMFTFPSEYVVVGPREWETLTAAGRLGEPYPDPPSIEEYRSYHGVCRDLADRFDVDAWTLYRALWRLSTNAPGSSSA